MALISSGAVGTHGPCYGHGRRTSDIASNYGSHQAGNQQIEHDNSNNTMGPDTATERAVAGTERAAVANENGNGKNLTSGFGLKSYFAVVRALSVLPQ
jgi:hypothetical protein